MYIFELQSAIYLAIGSLSYLVYYMNYYGQIPASYSKPNGFFTKFINKNVPSLKDNYWPLFFLPTEKFQTILATALPQVLPSPVFIKESIINSDGGEFLLAWSNQIGSEETDKIVLISPGLVSNTQTNYVQGIVRSMNEHGYQCVVVVNRGLETPLRTSKTYCATHITDLEMAISNVKSKCPNATILAIGISLGGVILSQYLSSKADKSEIAAAFVYCSPFNYVESAANIERWTNWLVYGYPITKTLQSYYMNWTEIFSGIVDHEAVMASNSVRQFDSNFTTKVFGYKNVDHYYQDSVLTTKKILSIRTPTLYLCANDDAFVPINAVPFETICQSDYLAISVTNGGGHVSHLQGLNPLNPPYYLKIMKEYADAVFTCLSEISDF